MSTNNKIVTVGEVAYVNLDTDSTMAADSDVYVPTQKAVKAAIASALSDSSPTELNFLDGATAGTQVASKAVIADANVNIGATKVTALHIGTSGSETEVTASAAELNIMAGVTATAAEINAACDISAIGQTITESGAVTAGKKSVLLNHTSVAIAATIADASLHAGYFIVKAGLEPGGGADHTCVITTGTWDGTNKTATFADVNDALVVFFDHVGNGTIISNTGTVSLSA